MICKKKKAFCLSVLILLVPLFFSGCDYFRKFFGEEKESVTETVDPSEGATIVHPEGATLIIPAGALNIQAKVTITDEGKDEPDDGSPFLFPISHTFKIEVDDPKAQFLKSPTLKLYFSDEDLDKYNLNTDYLILEVYEHMEIPWHTEPQDIITLNTSDIPFMKPVTVVDESLFIQRDIDPDVILDESITLTLFGTLEFPFDLYQPNPVLQVHHYTQGGLGWCVPTACARGLNYYSGLSSLSAECYYFSNWCAAGNNGQDMTSGALPLGGCNTCPTGVNYIENLGAGVRNVDYYACVYAAGAESFLHNYFIIVTQGSWDALDPWFGHLSPRPLIFGSDATAHEFNIVGATSDSIWIHDHCGVACAMDPSFLVAHCRDVTDLVFLFNDPKPEENRRGSLILEPGDIKFVDHYITAYPPTLTWKWDGNPYRRGYYWEPNSTTDWMADVNTARTGWTQAEDFAYVVSRTVDLQVSFKVANITKVNRRYTVELYVYAEGATSMPLIESKEIDVNRYSISPKTSFSSHYLSALESNKIHNVYLLLKEAGYGGAEQDAKRVQFYNFVLY